MRRIASVELLKLRTLGTLSRFALLTAPLVLVATFNAMASADFDRPAPVTSGKGFRVLGEPAPDVRVSNRDDARAVALAWTLVPLVVLALGIVSAGVARQHRTLPSSVLAVPGALVLAAWAGALLVSATRWLARRDLV